MGTAAHATALQYEQRRPETTPLYRLVARGSSIKPMADEIIGDVWGTMMEVPEQTIADEGADILPPVQLMLSGTSPEFSALAARFSGRFSELAHFATCPIDQTLEAVAEAKNCFAVIDWPVHHRAAARLDFIIRKNSSRGGVLAVTRSTDVSAIVGALDRGVDDCVGYEIDIRELAARLRTIWRKLLVRTATRSRGGSDLQKVNGFPSNTFDIAGIGALTRSSPNQIVTWWQSDVVTHQRPLSFSTTSLDLLQQ